ncbi:methylmalonyl Co-A mutase-associated GTPase MeaB [Solwaraspora sp. WMMB335]|uniref:methylmalonyl Co-A mutase-associated GTPase MeaB n=1 Tax=Solwaraspora sp. WMMB335 TaxID=3404118 RepID=UPI003B94AF2A
MTAGRRAAEAPATGGARRRAPDIDEYVTGVRAGAPAWIARAITLVESTRADHRELAQRLLVALSPHTGAARRVGITGVPGVGKSTFIDALGSRLTAAGHRVAVLAVDPSSARSGGSILGDKTRMARLAVDPAAYVRPSPTAGTLGGVARATREAMVVVEAAGFDVVLVETVGVGQSETTVADMVDTFLLLSLARTGDQLQGIKKGVLELADVIVVNKADGEHAAEARAAARELAGALRMLRGADSGWTTPVLTASGRDDVGLSEVWQQVTAHQDRIRTDGELHRRRQRQQLRWVWSMVQDTLLDRLRTHPAVAAVSADVEARVLTGEITAAQAATRLLDAFGAGTVGEDGNG